jgi:hypothetical protein
VLQQLIGRQSIHIDLPQAVRAFARSAALKWLAYFEILFEVDPVFANPLFCFFLHFYFHSDFLFL